MLKISDTTHTHTKQLHSEHKYPSQDDIRMPKLTELTKSNNSK